MNILIVDDDIALTESLVRLFEIQGHLVLSAPNLEEAERIVASLGKERTDLVLSDYDLGFDQPNGVEIVTTLRKSLPDARFVIMSGLRRDVPDDVEFVLKDRMDSILNVLKD